MSPISIPRYKAGESWNCFLKEFREMVQSTRVNASMHLLYLKQSIPEEAKKLLYQHEVETLDEAVEVLTELYEPTKDSGVLLQEFQKIVQRPGERLRVLAGRIEEAAAKCAKTAKLSRAAQRELVKSRFKHALIDEETRNQLLWERTELTLDEMVQKAQEFEDARKVEEKPKKTLRTKGEDQDLWQEVQRLKKELEK